MKCESCGFKVGDFGQMQISVNCMQSELEHERIRLAACGVAALANNEETALKQRITKDNPYWSASYQDVCTAVDREMKYRKALEEIAKLATSPHSFTAIAGAAVRIAAAAIQRNENEN